ncbi:alpha/beta hydrolase [Kitasatospora putterlickiae]|uniref:Alpha/beta hydrolase n=1 Tax=Kitasatospora putterlickiae TaxID=221725 RepID=A0ABP4J504_9ACTN
MKTHRATRPRLLLAAFAAGGLLLATACEGDKEPAQDQAASAPSSAATTAAAAAPTATPTPTPTVKPTGADDPALKPFYGQQITWAACPPDAKAAEQKIDLSLMKCGKLHVPLDYANPAGEAIDLALIKNPAAKQDQRLGSLMVNPGGPGGSGVEMVKSFDKQFEGTLHNRFDIVGWDPRGTGESSPVACLDDKQRDALNAEDGPLDPAAAKALSDKHAADFAAACQARSGKLLPFIGTRNTARDLDVLRAAVGDRKLNYLGISYGTYIGAVYAEEFPKNTGRLVLDGAVDPAAAELDLQVNQVIGFEKSFERFAVDCVKNNAAECPLGKSADKAAKKAADFLDGLRDKPLPTKDGRKVGSNLGWSAVIQFLYGDEKEAWQALRFTLAEAMLGGQGNALLAVADQGNGRDEKGHYSPEQEALRAIRCADNATPAPSAEAAQQAVQKLQREAPLLAKSITVEDVSEGSCVGWPFTSPETPHTIRAEGAAPILVVGTTGDPATPYTWSEKMAQGFAGATLLTRVGEGHGAFGSGNGCIDAAYAAYLTEGTLPAAGTKCS